MQSLLQNGLPNAGAGGADAGIRPPARKLKKEPGSSAEERSRADSSGKLTN